MPFYDLAMWTVVAEFVGKFAVISALACGVTYAIWFVIDKYNS